ncbi:VCBS, partial [Crocosphaera watsonii WH 0005]
MMNEPNSILGSFQTGNNETNVNSLVPEESGSEIYSSSLVGESLPEEDELEITARLLEEESYLETNLEQDTISLLGNSQDNDLYLRTNVDQELEYSYDGITFWGDINGETSELEPYQLSDNSQIIVDLKEGLDRLFVDQSLSEDLANFGATLTFYGGEGSDSLMGTQLNSLWEIEGENSGNLNQYILFEDLENLIGEEDNQDTFILKEGASLSGVLDGGEGG